jgi:hypothetical protein
MLHALLFLYVGWVCIPSEVLLTYKCTFCMTVYDFPSSYDHRMYFEARILQLCNKRKLLRHRLWMRHPHSHYRLSAHAMYFVGCKPVIRKLNLLKFWSIFHEVWSLSFVQVTGRLCVLVVRVAGYRSKGLDSIPGAITFSEN